MKRFGISLLVVTLAACSGNPFAPPPTPTPPPPEVAAPTLVGYRSYAANEVQGQVATIIELATATNQPHIAVLVGVIDGMSQCYQEQGALQLKMYSKEENALITGVLAIVDESRLTDPAVLATCALQTGSGGNGLIPEPCAASYTVEKDGKQIHISYAATDLEVCTALCTNLEGCTVHR